MLYPPSNPSPRPTPKYLLTYPLSFSSSRQVEREVWRPCFSQGPGSQFSRPRPWTTTSQSFQSQLKEVLAILCPGRISLCRPSLHHPRTSSNCDHPNSLPDKLPQPLLKPPPHQGTQQLPLHLLTPPTSNVHKHKQASQASQSPKSTTGTNRLYR